MFGVSMEDKVINRVETIDTERGRAYVFYINYAMPEYPKGFAFEDKTGKYTKHKGNGRAFVVVVASNVAEDVQRSVLRHELLHIELGHLDDRKHLTEEEKEREVEEHLLMEGYAVNYL